MNGTLKFRVLLALVAGSVLCAIPVWADPSSQVGRLSLISGSVSFRPGNLDEWAPAMLNYPLTAGDRLWTDTGARAEVHVFSAVMRLNSDTDFSFLSLDDATVQVRISEGSMNVFLRGVDQGTAFEIDTPDATLSLLSAGSYRIDVQQDGETSVTVRSGSAEVTAGGDVYDVNAGQGSVITGIDSVTYFVTAASRPDEWDAWCTSRDRREGPGASDSYVSREMIGAEDLGENGAWITVAGYGSAWAPSHVPPGWAPYRFGHWTWVEPWGWTWIDDAPWGFAPFHYGRWAYLNARWAWMPGASMARPVYAPALVVFVGGAGWAPAAGQGVGWFPLGPRELYIPPYQVSTSYIQRINAGHVASISQQTVERFNPGQAVYANRSAPRGMTFVPRDVFVQSRPAGGAVLSISMTEVARAPLMGMTAMVVPQRQSIIALPVAARGAPVPQPPADIMSRRVDSRIAPSPVRVPFGQQQKALNADPGRPVAPETLAGMQRGQKVTAPSVRFVNPATLVRQKNPPVQRKSPEAVVARNVPGSQQRMTEAPVPVSQQRVTASPPAAQPGITTPAQAAPQRVTTPPQRTASPSQMVASPPGKPPAAATRGSQGDSGAAALIASLKTRTLPDADQRLNEARKVSGVRIDLNAVAGQLAAARQTLAGAEKDLAGGNSAQAMQKATAVQKQVDDLVNRLASAVQDAKQAPQKR